MKKYTKICGERKTSVRGAIGLFILVLLAFFLIFRNSLFYSNSIIQNEQSNTTNMFDYKEVRYGYEPTSTQSCFKINSINKKANGLDITFNRQLPETLNISLFLQQNGEETLVETKTIRGGYKNVSFYFDKQISRAKIIFELASGEGLSIVPSFDVQIKNREITIFDWTIDRIIMVLILISGACILTYLIVKQRISQQRKDVVKKERESNFELLRIFCMIILIGYHFLMHGGVLDWPQWTSAKILGLIFIPFGKTCFIAFIAISMWFYVDTNTIKFERFFKTFFQVIFYSVSLTVLAYTLGASVTITDFIGSFFVMIGNSHGFAASYLIFLLLLPFIKKGTEGITKGQARYLLVVLFWIQLMSRIIYAITNYNQPVHSEVTLFIFCYILSLNLKMWPVKIIDEKIKLLIIMLGLFFYIIIINGTIYFEISNRMVSILRGMMYDESSLVYILTGYCLFFIFKNIKIKYNRYINSIAGLTFGILLIHDHNFLRKIFWKEIVASQLYFDSTHFILYFIAIIAGIFYVCAMIEYLRKNLIETVVLNTIWYQRIVKKMNRLFCQNSKEG